MEFLFFLSVAHSYCAEHLFPFTLTHLSASFSNILECKIRLQMYVGMQSKRTARERERKKNTSQFFSRFSFSPDTSYKKRAHTICFSLARSHIFKHQRRRPSNFMPFSLSLFSPCSLGRHRLI